MNSLKQLKLKHPLACATHIHTHAHTHTHTTHSHNTVIPHAQIVVHNLFTTLVASQNIHTIPTGIHHQQQQNNPSTTLECNYYFNYIALLYLQCIFGFNNGIL